MSCLPEHPHALVSDGVVTNIAVFAGHDPDLVDAIRVAGVADVAVCLCGYGGIPGIGWSWDGATFTAPDLTSEP